MPKPKQSTRGEDVETVLDSRMHKPSQFKKKPRAEYLVKWKTSAPATWIHMSYLKGPEVTDAIADFHHRHPDAFRPIDFRQRKGWKPPKAPFLPTEIKEMIFERMLPEESEVLQLGPKPFVESKRELTNVSLASKELSHLVTGVLHRNYRHIHMNVCPCSVPSSVPTDMTLHRIDSLTINISYSPLERHSTHPSGITVTPPTLHPLEETRVSNIRHTLEQLISLLQQTKTLRRTEIILPRDEFGDLDRRIEGAAPAWMYIVEPLMELPESDQAIVRIADEPMKGLFPSETMISLFEPLASWLIAGKEERDAQESEDVEKEMLDKEKNVMAQKD